MDYKELEKFLRQEVPHINLGTGTADYVHQYTSFACNACMSRIKSGKKQSKKQVHWWTAEVEELAESQ